MLFVVLVVAMPPDAISVLQPLRHVDNLSGGIVQVFAVAGVSVPADEEWTAHVEIVNPDRAAHARGTPERAVGQPRLLVADIVSNRFADHFLLGRGFLTVAEKSLEELRAHGPAIVQRAEDHQTPEAEAPHESTQFRGGPNLGAEFGKPRVVAGSDLVVLEHETLKIPVTRCLIDVKHPIERHAPGIIPGNALRRSSGLSRLHRI